MRYRTNARPQAATVCKIPLPSSGSPKIKPCVSHARLFLPSTAQLWNSLPAQIPAIRSSGASVGRLIAFWLLLCQQLLNDNFVSAINAQLCHVVKKKSERQKLTNKKQTKTKKKNKTKNNKNKTKNKKAKNHLPPPKKKAITRL